LAFHAQKSPTTCGAKGFLIRPQDGIPPSPLREQIITEMLKHPAGRTHTNKASKAPYRKRRIF
jgi:hypothetical protein